MRTIELVGVGVVLAALGAGMACGGDGSSGSGGGPGPGPGPTPVQQGLVGTWQATRAEFVHATNSNVRVEIVSRGATLVLSLDAAGRYTRTLTPVGDPPDVQTGTWTSSTDVLTLHPSGVTFTIQFDYAVANTTLALAGGHVEFDFDDDNRFEEAILNATFSRQ